MTTRADASSRALAWDKSIERQIAAMTIEPCKEMVRRIRAFLLKRADEIKKQNNVIAHLRTSRPDRSGTSTINYGPTMDEGATESHFYFDSGARLCFGITVREVGAGCEILSFRFHYHAPVGKGIEFLRIDLNSKSHQDPLLEPRCHLHAGLEGVRVPFAAISPLEILDRIFFAVDPQFK